MLKWQPAQWGLTEAIADAKRKLSDPSLSYFILYLTLSPSHTAMKKITQHYICASSLTLTSQSLSTQGLWDEETTINMLHLFDLCSTWSKAEGNRACRAIYGPFNINPLFYLRCTERNSCSVHFWQEFAGVLSCSENYNITGCCSKRDWDNLPVYLFLQQSRRSFGIHIVKLKKWLYRGIKCTTVCWGLLPPNNSRCSPDHKPSLNNLMPV